MNEEKKTDLALDPDRAAYMIAWRDRYIERLQQRLTGREEENAMMSTLLFYGLFHAATEHEGERCVRIPTQAVAELLGQWQCHTVSEGADYAVYFTPRSEAEQAHAEESGRE